MGLTERLRERRAIRGFSAGTCFFFGIFTSSSCSCSSFSSSCSFFCQVAFLGSALILEAKVDAIIESSGIGIIQGFLHTVTVGMHQFVSQFESTLDG